MGGRACDSYIEKGPGSHIQRTGGITTFGRQYLGRVSILAPGGRLSGMEGHDVSVHLQQPQLGGAQLQEDLIHSLRVYADTQTHLYVNTPLPRGL